MLGLLGDNAWPTAAASFMKGHLAAKGWWRCQLPQCNAMRRHSSWPMVNFLVGFMEELWNHEPTASPVHPQTAVAMLGKARRLRPPRREAPPWSVHSSMPGPLLCRSASRPWAACLIGARSPCGCTYVIGDGGLPIGGFGPKSQTTNKHLCMKRRYLYYSVSGARIARQLAAVVLHLGLFMVTQARTPPLCWRLDRWEHEVRPRALSKAFGPASRTSLEVLQRT